MPLEDFELIWLAGGRDDGEVAVIRSAERDG